MACLLQQGVPEFLLMSPYILHNFITRLATILEPPQYFNYTYPTSTGSRHTSSEVGGHWYIGTVQDTVSHSVSLYSQYITTVLQ
jgi:hypothetical protein